jgi:hypothetical protein
VGRVVRPGPVAGGERGELDGGTEEVGDIGDVGDVGDEVAVSGGRGADVVGVVGGDVQAASATRAAMAVMRRGSPFMVRR